MSITWNALRAQIDSFTNPFPAAAIAAADAHRAELVPHLVESIARLAEDPAVGADPDYALHLYAMHILATWRETTAYAPLVRLGHHPADLVEQLLGDTLTESYGRCLASVCDGDLGLLQGLVEDAAAAPWARNAALDAIMVRVLEGDAARDDLIAYLLRLGDTEAARLAQPGVRKEAFELLNSIISVATEIGAVELLERIRGWYAAGLADALTANLPRVEEHIARPYAVCRDEMLARGKGYVVSVKAEIGWFSPDVPTPAPPKPQPVVAMPPRQGAKPGRNDPCLCGSGKKYKKCCGA